MHIELWPINMKKFYFQRQRRHPTSETACYFLFNKLFTLCISYHSAITVNDLQYNVTVVETQSFLRATACNALRVLAIV